MYPTAGSTAAGILAITVAMWFLAMSTLDKAQVRNCCVHTCQVLCIVYTAVSTLIIFVVSVAQDKGEMLRENLRAELVDHKDHHRVRSCCILGILEWSKFVYLFDVGLHSYYHMLAAERPVGHYFE